MTVMPDRIGSPPKKDPIRVYLGSLASPSCSEHDSRHRLDDLQSRLYVLGNRR